MGPSLTDAALGSTSPPGPLSPSTSSGQALRGEGEEERVALVVEPLPQSLRLFVAIELSDGWRQALGVLQADMQSALARDPALARTRVRWVRPEGIHLTLKFLGNVAPDRLDAIECALGSAVPNSPGLELALATAGAFSDRRAPRVIWATFHIRPDYRLLHQLFERIETWLAAAGFPRERRSFAPHLTLARLPEDIDVATRQRVAEVTTSVTVPQADPLTIDHVSLMRSHLGPGGAHYERLGRYPAT